MVDAPNILIIDARFYEDIADELVRGATAALEAAGCSIGRLSVPGTFEIPAALSLALEAASAGLGPDYDGFVLLGCVIRGETTHYEVVAIQSARAVIDLSVAHGLALGNGILTVENPDQAWIRARVTELDKGGDAARAALTMVALKRGLGL
ncbi:MAG: 6,7-dimethyl-8-ribityllumazine synthase [Cucumibacter sp.]